MSFFPKPGDDPLQKVNQLPGHVQEKIHEWLRYPLDRESVQALATLLQEDLPGVINAFDRDLSFGTSGVRALTGIGSYRLNVYTIAKLSQAVANYLRKDNLRIIIAYDNRKDSLLFATVAARVLAAANIHVYVLKEIRPSPFLSFAIRLNRCDAGIMITASHNPKEYNGYELYGDDGGAIDTAMEEGIQSALSNISSFEQVHMTPIYDPHIEWINPITWDAAYLSAIKALQYFPEQDYKLGNTLQIVYSSLHGTGSTLAPKALASWGFSSLYLVEEQINPDPAFPTLTYPNPGDKEASQLGLQKLAQTSSDLFIANDCDADRIGVAVMHKGLPCMLSGNELSILCAYHLCSHYAKLSYPLQKMIILTVISSDLIKYLVEDFHMRWIEVPVGFKYISAKMREWGDKVDEYFLMGTEESYGCLMGTYARNKDGIAGAAVIAEIALQAKVQGKTLIDLLHTIYTKYGLFPEKLHSLEFHNSSEGLKKRDELMYSLRSDPPSKIGSLPVISYVDYLAPDPSLIQTDMIIMQLKDHSKIVIRPSGTEPLLRVYVSSHIKNFTSIEEGKKQGDLYVAGLLQDVLQCFSQ